MRKNNVKWNRNTIEMKSSKMQRFFFSMHRLLPAMALLTLFSCTGRETEAQQPSHNYVRPAYVDLTPAAEHTVNTVVHINAEMLQKNSMWDNFFSDPFFNFFNFQAQPQVYQAYGSGVILSTDGYIVTNNHVVENAQKITVTLNDQRKFQAEIIGTDVETDLALLKIDAKGLDYIEYGNSDEVRLGEWVLAVGNPYNLNSTVTAGIVSAKARNLDILGKNTRVESFIQTDAAVNSGNSGGALVNIQGKLIGINAAIASNTGSYAGYSFAIPVNVVKKVVADLKQYGHVKSATPQVPVMKRLGAELQPISAEARQNYQVECGVKVVRISDGGSGGFQFNPVGSH